MRRIIKGAQSVGHGMDDSQAAVGKSHAGKVLPKGHAFPALRLVLYRVAQAAGNDLDCL